MVSARCSMQLQRLPCWISCRSVMHVGLHKAFLLHHSSEQHCSQMSLLLSCARMSRSLAFLTAGADASSEGVQRDLLPIIEGSVVTTKYGNVNTDHILFICSGAFHSCKPADMLAELQGRLPIRVELKGLT